MNSNYGKKGMNSFDFDLGIGSGGNRSRPLNDQRNKPTNNTYSYPSSTSSYSQPARPAGSPMPSWQPNKPSWTHQPAPARTTSAARSELGGPTSMVGDILGKSWNSTAPATGSGAGIGVVINKDPNLFGDLVNSAFGQKNTAGNAPLKSAVPATSSFSMGGMADSLPKTSGSAGGDGNSWGNFAGASNVSGGYGSTTGLNYGSSNGMSKGSTPSVNAFGGIGGSSGDLGTASRKDPFGSLFDIGGKGSSSGGNLNAAATSKATPSKATTTSSSDFGFGAFQNASSASSTNPPNLFPSNNSSGSTQKSFQPSGSDSFDVLFSSSSSSATAATASATEQGGSQPFSGADDWGMDTGFGEHDSGNTTELEGLPLPPAGVSASTAKGKGMDNYKQGQYADAIKWLSWAVILLTKSGDVSGKMEVLSSRASCYKEVGEYKKAVADCTEVLEQDENNVLVLVQRALLYESMEKYKLGANDLRTVMKLDPMNRVARSTIHRLNKMAECC